MKGKRNRGMTMVEILIAFVVLTLVMAILYSCIQFSSNLMKEAADVDRENAAFEEAVVNRFTADDAYNLGDSEVVTYSFKESGGSGDSYDVQVHSVNLSFEGDQNGYTEVAAGSTGHNVRGIYLFSTSGEGSTSGE